MQHFDNVDKPRHYNLGKIECIDAIEAATKNLKGMDAICTGHVLRYAWRWPEKNGVEDLKKARWYLDRLIKKVEDEEREAVQNKMDYMLDTLG